jgi:AcrR family transcriptional regulator
MRLAARTPSQPLTLEAGRISRSLWVDANGVFAGLNVEQRRTVEEVHGPVCIHAAADSGKSENFGSKARLYAAVLNDAADTLVAELRAVLDDDGASVVAVLGEILAPGHIDRMHARGSPGALFADAVALTAEPGIEAAARRGMRKVADALVDLVRRGQAQGELSADVDPPAAAWGLLSLIASHRFRNVVMPDRKRRCLDSGLITLYLDSLR